MLATTALLVLAWPSVRVEAAATLPPGFSEYTTHSGLEGPAAFDFAPDGTLFVAERRGTVQVFDGVGDTTPRLFADLRTKVHNYADRGLVGLVVDRAWPTRPYVYVLYAYDAPVGGTAPTYGNAGEDSDSCPTYQGIHLCPAQVRVSRLVASGGVMSSEVVLLKDLCHQFPVHDGGGMAVGPDGALYVSFGEGATPLGDWGNWGGNCNDPPNEGGSLRAQDLRTSGDPAAVNGAVVRISRDTGQASQGNPLAGSPDLEARKILAYGLRNPFRLTIRPGTNEVWVADVGSDRAEEIDRVPVAAPVENFGWPCYEGAARHSSWDARDIPLCENLYAQGPVTNPYFSYAGRTPIVPGEPCPNAGGSVISGIDFYEGGGYPARYQGALFFTDGARQCIWVMLKGSNGLPDPARVELFASGVGFTVDLRTGPGGDLFYLDIAAGELRRIHNDGANTPPTPVLDTTPSSGPPPLQVTLDGSRSSDPDPGDTLRYAWDTDDDGAFDDGTAVQRSVTFAARGQYRVRLRVTDSHNASRIAVAFVTVGSTPVATIDTPTASTTWSVGQQVSFSGRGTDATDGTLPASGLDWTLILHHCYTPTDCHPHHIQDFPDRASGSFSAPDHEYPAQLELQLTATNSAGVQHTSSVSLQPRTTTLRFTSDPPGFTLSVASRTDPAPFDVTAIVGSNVVVAAPSPQRHDDEDWTFAGWSDGGAQTHTVVAGPPGLTTYTATYAAPK